MRRARPLVVALALLLVGAGTGIGIGRAETVKDGAGREVTVLDTVAQIVAAGPPAEVLLLVLAPDRVAGWTRMLPAEQGRWLEHPPSGRVIGRLTGGDADAAIKAVREVRPDLILDYGDVGGRYAALADRVQAEAGAPVLLLDGRLAAIGATLRLLGPPLGQRERAEMLASQAEEILAQVRERTAALPAERRRKVFFARGGDGLGTRPPESLTGEVIAAAGGTNAAAAGEPAITRDALAAADPDLVVAASPDAAAGLRRSVPTLRAVREGHVAVQPTQPFGWVDDPPSVNRLLGVVWIAGLLYPELFPEPLAGRMQDFHERFYGKRPNDADVAALLESMRPRQ